MLPLWETTAHVTQRSNGRRVRTPAWPDNLEPASVHLASVSPPVHEGRDSVLLGGSFSMRPPQVLCLALPPSPLPTGLHSRKKGEGQLGATDDKELGPVPLRGDEGQTHPSPGGAWAGFSQPSSGGLPRGRTWFEAHACLSVQSLWLRTYHHWISSE